MIKQSVPCLLFWVLVLGCACVSQGDRVMASADYNWPDSNNTADQDWNWYEHDSDQTFTQPLRLFSSADISGVYTYQKNGVSESEKMNTATGLVTEATIIDDSSVVDASGKAFPPESYANRSIARPIYASPFANRCGMVYSLSADGGAHWTDTYPGQNIRFAYPGSDLRWKVYSWSNTEGADTGGECSPSISGVHVYYNTDIFHTDHTFNSDLLKDFPYSTVYYKSVPSLPVIKDGDMIQVSGDPDIYIVKYIGERRYRRLILSPSVFKSYGHLKWENVISVDRALMNSFENFSYVRVAGDSSVWQLAPNGDTGTKHLVRDLSAISDPEAVYEINTTDRDSYVRGTDID